MRVKIISDSTCDLSPALLERYDIAVTPLCVIKDGKDFHDGVDITPADIFAHVDGGGDLCSTSAVSQYEYGEMFARYANAVLWAVENGVTTGASATTFDPAGDCTRGQIVTFLYRCLSK